MRDLESWFEHQWRLGQSRQHQNDLWRRCTCNMSCNQGRNCIIEYSDSIVNYYYTIWYICNKMYWYFLQFAAWSIRNTYRDPRETLGQRRFGLAHNYKIYWICNIDMPSFLLCNGNFPINVSFKNIVFNK